MDCERARVLLDAYIDGELSGDEMRALKNHAKACEACGRELEAAEMLRDTLAHMDDDLVVPIEAQAAWRSAVRTEAKRKNARRWMRMAYAAAAVLVLAVGSVTVINAMPAQENMQLSMDAGASAKSVSLIEADGAQPLTVSRAMPEQSAYYSARKKIATDNPDEAVKELEMLSAEYSGSCSQDGEGIYRIELPYEYMQDFLDAASRIGTELYSQISESEAETAVILVQLSNE